MPAITGHCNVTAQDNQDLSQVSLISVTERC